MKDQLQIFTSSMPHSMMSPGPEPSEHCMRSSMFPAGTVVEAAVQALEPDPDRQESVLQGWIRSVEALLQRPDTQEWIARATDALDAHGTLDQALFLDCIR